MPFFTTSHPPETLIEANVAGIRAELDKKQAFMSRLKVERACLLRIEYMKAFPHHRSAQIDGALLETLEDDTQDRFGIRSRTNVARTMRSRQAPSDAPDLRHHRQPDGQRLIRLFNRLSAHGGSILFDDN